MKKKNKVYGQRATVGRDKYKLYLCILEEVSDQTEMDKNNQRSLWSKQGGVEVTGVRL